MKSAAETQIVLKAEGKPLVSSLFLASALLRRNGQYVSVLLKSCCDFPFPFSPLLALSTDHWQFCSGFKITQAKKCDLHFSDF